MNAQTPTHQSAYMKAQGKLAPFADPRSVLTESLDLLSPPSRISVVEAAEKYRVMQEDTHQGLWDSNKVPYMVEPMNMTQSRQYVAMVFIGPARSGKSDSLILNRILYLMTCASGRAMLVNMDQKSTAEYSTTEIDRMIRLCAALSDKQETGRGADNLYQKLFKGGGRLELAWPTPAAFANKTVRDVMITERDRLPDDIGGDGDPFTLGKKRGTIAGSMAMCIEECSPKRPIKTRDYKLDTIHQAPPCDGITADYNLGTRARWYWTCPSCDHEFEADFDNLKCSDEGDNFTRSQSVYMLCPSTSGCIIEMHQKRDINIAGRWLHESKCGQKAVPLGDPEMRESDTLSYWLKGVSAAFQNWQKLMFEYLQAKADFEATGNEKKLQVFWNTSNGVPMLPHALDAQASLNADELKQRASFRPLGVVPKEARFITAQVDIQGASFEVQVDAFGVGLERWLVDRYSINVPPEDAPQSRNDAGEPRRPIQPALYAEDWKALDTIANRVFPVEDSAHGLMPVAITIDRNGPPGATEKAYAFWRSKRKARQAHRWFLVAGVGYPDAERIVFSPPQKASSKFKKAARDVPILKIKTTDLKDEVCASLLREEDGAGRYHLTTQMEHRYFEEFCAEERDEKRWKLKAGVKRNECFDLAYYGKALVVHLGCETMAWQSPPIWAVAGSANSFAVSLEEGETPSVEMPMPVEKPVMKSRARRMAEMAKARQGKVRG